MDKKTLRPDELPEEITLRPEQLKMNEQSKPSKKIASWEVIETLQNRTLCEVFSVVNSLGINAIMKLYRPNVLRNEAAKSVFRIKDDRLLEILENGSWQGCEYEVTPLMEGSLDGELLDCDVLMKVVIPQLIHAIEILHTNGYLHNDVKPSNLFWLRHNSSLVLGDYDNVSYADKKTYDGLGITTEYAAPEVLVTGPAAFSFESDICSVGLTLISLLTGASPLHDKTDAQKKRIWMRGISIPENIPAHLKILINGMIQYDPEKRITLDSIHRWMRTYNIEDQLSITEAAETFSTKKEIIPLRFGNRIITSINDMIESCGSDWQMGCFLLKQKRLSIFLRQFDFELFQLCSQCERIFDQNEGLFTLLHSMRKRQDFFWFGEIYNNLEDFSLKMLESPDSQKFSEGALFIRLNLMEIYQDVLGLVGRYTDFYNELARISKRDPELALTKLLTSISRIPEFRWRERVFTELEELIAWILYMSPSLDDDIYELYHSRRFEAWLECIGRIQFLRAIQDDMKMRTG